MRLLGIFLTLVGLGCAGWSTATYVFKNTYFRPLADASVARETYSLAVDAGSLLAEDLFLPAIVSSTALVACGLGIVLKRRKKAPNQLPETTRGK